VEETVLLIIIVDLVEVEQVVIENHLVLLQDVIQDLH
jgi:hypothetical protein